ncbi:MAG: hypothetical protein KF753_04650 [Caldilineaceae bacterium]|nr:hypothetical protein [Caldilineaceae bacterium]
MGRLAGGLTSVAEVRFCLDRLRDVTPSLPPLDLIHRPELLLATTKCLPSALRSLS